MLLKNVLIWNEQVDFITILEKMDIEGNGFLVIVDTNYILLGIVTDGDIRRAILNKTTDLWEIINKKPVLINTNISRTEAIKILHKIERRQIPVVDENNKLINIFYLGNDEKYFNNNYVIIMAGGLGSRLNELTTDTPKPMLNVGGKPILETIILNFRDFGFNKFIICVNYKAEKIIEYFNNGDKWGVDITYNIENKKMGTAGALGLIDLKLDKSFFVVNGDVISNVNLQDFLNFHLINNSNLTMCVKNIDYQIPYGCIEVDSSNKITSIEEKPKYNYNINSGMYILEPNCINHIKENEFFDMTSLVNDLILANEKVFAFIHNEYWIDIGYKSDYQKANSDFTINS